MFDSDTCELISGAPPLDGLDLGGLPQELTETFASVVAARLLVARGETEWPDGLRAELGRLKRLATTYEGYVTGVFDHPQRRSAAYVAANIHHLLHLAEALQATARPFANRLTPHAISADVSAMLLFLIADQPAEAIEIANRIGVEDPRGPSDALLNALSMLVRGDLAGVETAASSPSSTEGDGAGDDDLVADVFWLTMLSAVRRLAQELGNPATNIEDAWSDTSRVLESAKQACVEPIEEASSFLGQMTPYSVFAGPRHLAVLLMQAARSLLASAVSKLPAPSGMPSDQWHDFLGRYATIRPFLWRSHSSAIASGFLGHGVSAVVSFPTGAGKSTLADLKIAATRIIGKKVIYLAPTNALIDQIRDSLKRVFLDADVATSRLVAADYAEVEGAQLPDIAVVTPERCLGMLAVSPEPFEDVGLVVFDECHLMHPKQEVRDRRALDAMMCVLRLAESAPTADLLFMSAMVANAEELAAWVQTNLGRDCRPLTVGWKPTRQARGCVVYQSGELAALRNLLNNEWPKAVADARAKALRKGKQPPREGPKPNVAVKRQLTAVPFCLFGLRNTWSVNTEDYKLLKLDPHPFDLSASGNATGWWLTANRNDVAARLAAGLADAGIKTLVFVQQPKHSMSVARRCAGLMETDLISTGLSESETAWAGMAISELGGAEHIFAPIGGLAACHHGLLLPSERQLNESLFARPDGVPVLVATSTLAEGMNLPAQAVVIAGDDRFDAEAGKPASLEAHELLNAAGRAGRAGHFSQGIVLVVPGAVVGFDSDKNAIEKRWFTLQENVFSKSDQCLEVIDPVGLFLDAIDVASTTEELVALRFFLQRLPFTEEGGNAAARAMLKRSFAAFHAQQQGELQEFDARVEKALVARDKDDPVKKQGDWLDEIAAKSGNPRYVVRDIEGEIHQTGFAIGMSTLAWAKWFFEWLNERPTWVYVLMRLGDFERVFGRRPAKEVTRWLKSLVGMAAAATELWLNGATLKEIEIHLGTSADRVGFCEKARHFSLRCIPQISYAIGLAAQIHRGYVDRNDGVRMPVALGTVAACVRDGYDTPEKLAFQYLARGQKSRRQVHEAYELIAPRVAGGDVYESFPDTLSRVRSAMT